MLAVAMLGVRKPLGADTLLSTHIPPRLIATASADILILVAGRTDTSTGYPILCVVGVPSTLANGVRYPTEQARAALPMTQARSHQHGMRRLQALQGTLYEFAACYTKAMV
jgi:hypothetical protein